MAEDTSPTIVVPSGELLGWTVRKPPWGPRVQWHPVLDRPRAPRTLPESYVPEESPAPSRMAAVDGLNNLPHFVPTFPGDTQTFAFWVASAVALDIATHGATLITEWYCIAPRHITAVLQAQRPVDCRLAAVAKAGEGDKFIV